MKQIDKTALPQGNSSEPDIPFTSRESITRLRPGVRMPHAQHTTMILIILCLSVFMAGLDLFIVNVALDRIGQSMGQSSLSDLSWILNAYAIFFAAVLVPAGRLVDRYGRKAGFLVGMAIFTCASLGCAVSVNLGELVAFRCIQAIGAAVLTPSSLGLLLTSMPSERVTRSVRIWASSSSLAGVAGPVIGGLLVNANWQWVFVINLPIGIVAFVAALMYLPNPKHGTSKQIPDLPGGLLLILSIGALALGLVKAPDWGWGSSGTIMCWIITVITFGAFAFRSTRHPVPIVEPSLLKNPVFAWSNIAALLLAIAFAMQMLGIILFLQESWHWSALATGLGIAPGPCMVSLFAIVGQRLTRRFPVGIIAAIGISIIVLASILFLFTGYFPPVYAVAILPGWLLIGIGIGLAMPTIIVSATADLPRHQTATGSAVVNMSRQIGTVLGTSLLVVLLGTSASDLVNGFFHLWWLSAALLFLCAIVCVGITPRHPKQATLNTTNGTQSLSRQPRGEHALYSTIVAAIDGGTGTDTILKHAAAIASQHQGVVIVFSLREIFVNLGIGVTIGQELDDDETDRSTINAALAQLEALHVQAQAYYADTRIDTITAPFVSAVTAAHADLLVLGLHHHTLLTAFFEQPVEEEVMKSTAIPVLLVPAI